MLFMLFTPYNAIPLLNVDSLLEGPAVFNPSVFFPDLSRETADISADFRLIVYDLESCFLNLKQWQDIAWATTLTVSDKLLMIRTWIRTGNGLHRKRTAASD